MKFQEIILHENRKLSRQLLLLNQALYEERNERLKACSQAKIRYKVDESLKNEEYAQQFMDLRKRYEAAQRRVTDLECDNAKVLEEFLRVTNEKEFKVKEVFTQNQQLKTENAKQSSKIKELDYEMQRLR